MARSKQLIINVTCRLDDEHFSDWEDMSPEIIEFWDYTPGYPHCGEDGGMGAWCKGCYFCDEYEGELQ